MLLPRALISFSTALTRPFRALKVRTKEVKGEHHLPLDFKCVKEEVSKSFRLEYIVKFGTLLCR